MRVVRVGGEKAIMNGGKKIKVSDPKHPIQCVSASTDEIWQLFKRKEVQRLRFTWDQAKS